MQTVQWLPPVLYGIAASLYLVRFLDRSRDDAKGLSQFLSTALLVHFLSLVAQGILRGRLPFASMGEALSVSAFVLAVSYAVIERQARTASLGVFFLAPVFLATALSAGAISATPWPPRLQSWLFALHASTGASALALLFASSLLGGAYLLQYRLLESRRFGSLSRGLPGLPVLDRCSRLCGSIGTVLLAVSAISGGVWIAAWHLALGHATAKTVITLSTVLWFSGIALLGRRKSFTSRSSARLAMLGGILVVLVLLAGIHG